MPNFKSIIKGTTIHKKKLLTMSSQKKKQKRHSAKEKEYETVIKCLQHRLTWANQTGQQYKPETEQYFVYPRALCDEDGIPYKPPQNHWASRLRARYNTVCPPVFSSQIMYTPEVVILDAMFLINTKPTKTVSEYAKLLYSRFVLEHFNCGVSEVHIVFDTRISDGTFTHSQLLIARDDKKVSMTIPAYHLDLIPH